MKIVCLPIAAALAFAALTPALTAENTAGKAQMEEISASKKRGPTPFYRYIDPATGEVVTRYRRDYLVPSNDFEGGYYAGEYAWRRAIGQCVEDLGYGRWKGC